MAAKVIEEAVVIRRVCEDSRFVAAHDKLAELNAQRSQVESRIDELEKTLGRDPRGTLIKARSEAMAADSAESREHAKQVGTQAEELRNLRIDFEALEMAIGKIETQISSDGTLYRQIVREIQREVTPAHDKICADMAKALTELRKHLQADMDLRSQLALAGVEYGGPMRCSFQANAITTFGDYSRIDRWIDTLTAPRQAS